MESNQDGLSAATKRKTPECDSGKSTSAFIFAVVKKLSICSFIYWAGYMNWSIAWIVTPILVGETREYLSETFGVRRRIAKESARGNERGAILARVRDLPSWVNDIDFIALFKIQPFFLSFWFKVK